MKNIVLFGPPGSGKGTQALNIVSKYNLIHLSTGDMLRAEIAAGTELGSLAKAIIDRGDLVPDDIVIDMIENKLDEHPYAHGFVFDGFPRTVAQAEALDELLDERDAPIRVVLSLVVSEDELIRRIVGRGLSSGRTDDQNEEVIKNRVVEYRTKTEPLAIYYAEQGKLAEIPGEGSIENIFELLCEEIDDISDNEDRYEIEDEEAEDIVIPVSEGETVVIIEDEGFDEDEEEVDDMNEEADEDEEEIDEVELVIAVKKPAAKKAPAKKAAVKKAAAKKAPAKKAAAKKAPVRKVELKTTKKAAPVKKAATPVKKAHAKTTKKVAPPAKAASKKAPVKKVPVKKAPAKKAVKKVLVGKTAARKSLVKKAAPKVAPKKVAGQKAAPKKATAKKAVAQKPVVKSVVKKSIKKVAAKKTAVKPASLKKQ